MTNQNPKIKIKFHEFIPNCDLKSYWIWQQLSKFYDLELSDNPDILIYSVWNSSYFVGEYLNSDIERYNIFKNNPNCIRIFYTPENVRPNFYECDIAISFDYSDNPKNIRLPYYMIRTLFDIPDINFNRLTSDFKQNYQYNKKTKFCCIVRSRNWGEERNIFIEKLSKYKKVDEGGKYSNNIGYYIGSTIIDKLNFIKDYKFVISFENSKYPGYTTEKIMEAMCVGSIPIYWGNPLINKEFNIDSFINVDNINNIDDVIERIIEIDNNDDLFYNIQHKSNLINDRIQDFQIVENQLSKLKELIDNLLIERNIIHLNKSKFISNYKFTSNLNNDFLFLCNWINSIQTNSEIYQHCLKNSQNIDFLLNHYNITKNRAFGELAFKYMWLVILNQLPNNSNLLEIGVYKGASISLMSLISNKLNKNFNIFAITPLTNVGDKYSEYDNIDYLYEIKKTYLDLDLDFNENNIINGLSTNENIKKITSKRKYNLIYIDGGHDYDTVINDINFSDSILSENGFIIMDDASVDLYFSNDFEGFKGHNDVAKAINDSDILKNKYKHLFACGHNRCWKKIN